jgi:hypothetical protein
MTPEDKFQKDFSYVLNKLKEQSLYVPKDYRIPYKLYTTVVDMTGETPLVEEEVMILAKLAEMGAIKDFDFTADHNNTPTLQLELLQPKFDEIYNNKGKFIDSSQEPTFDKDAGTIKRAGKECALPFKKTEYYIAEALFANPPETKLTENDLMAATDIVADKADSGRRIYDAMQRINKKAKADLDIDKLIHYKNSHYWIAKT